MPSDAAVPLAAEHHVRCRAQGDSHCPQEGHAVRCPRPTPRQGASVAREHDAGQPGQGQGPEAAPRGRAAQARAWRAAGSGGVRVCPTGAPTHLDCGRDSSGRCDESSARCGEGVRSQGCSRPQRPHRPGTPDGAGKPALGRGPRRQTRVGLVPVAL